MKGKARFAAGLLFGVALAAAGARLFLYRQGGTVSDPALLLPPDTIGYLEVPPIKISQGWFKEFGISHGTRIDPSRPIGLALLDTQGEPPGYVLLLPAGAEGDAPLGPNGEPPAAVAGGYAVFTNRSARIGEILSRGGGRWIWEGPPPALAREASWKGNAAGREGRARFLLRWPEASEWAGARIAKWIGAGRAAEEAAPAWEGALRLMAGAETVAGSLRLGGRDLVVEGKIAGPGSGLHAFLFDENEAALPFEEVLPKGALLFGARYNPDAGGEWAAGLHQAMEAAGGTPTPMGGDTVVRRLAPGEIAVVAAGRPGGARLTFIRMEDAKGFDTYLAALRAGFARMGGREERADSFEGRKRIRFTCPIAGARVPYSFLDLDAGAILCAASTQGESLAVSPLPEVLGFAPERLCEDTTYIALRALLPPRFAFFLGFDPRGAAEGPAREVPPAAFVLVAPEAGEEARFSFVWRRD